MGCFMMFSLARNFNAILVTGWMASEPDRFFSFSRQAGPIAAGYRLLKYGDIDEKKGEI